MLVLGVQIMKVFLDDVRNPESIYEYTDGWITVRTVEEAKTLLLTKQVVSMSLDHDLGENQPTGYDLTKWMAENDCWPKSYVWVHSMNPVGAQNMYAMIDRYFLKGEPDF